MEVCGVDCTEGGIDWNRIVDSLDILFFIFFSTINGNTFSAMSRTSEALDPTLIHRSCMFKFLFVKFSRIYLKEIRLRGESLFCRIAVAGSRRLSNISVVLDLALIFFVVWFLDFVFLTAGVPLPNSIMSLVNVGEGGADGHEDSGAGLLKVAWSGCESDISS